MPEWEKMREREKESEKTMHATYAFFDCPIEKKKLHSAETACKKKKCLFAYDTIR